MAHRQQLSHALSRAVRGLVGKLMVEGPEQSAIIREGIDEKLRLLID